MKLNILIKSKIRCIIAIVLSVLLVVITFSAMLYRLFYFEGVQSGTDGINSFKMFTILSNCVVAVCCLLSIPYQIDGLRTNNYHLPRWIVDTLYVGVTCVSVVFLISLTILSPVMGFEQIMLQSTNLFFHTINPLICLTLFIFLDSYHTIKLYKNFIAIIPLVIYLIVYAIMVFYLKEWDDFYKLDAFIPGYVSIPIAIPVGFFISFAIRAAHNKVHNYQKHKFFSYYSNSEEYSKGMDESIRLLVKGSKQDPKGDIVIPRRIIEVLMKRYNCKENIEFYINKYIEQYYKQ